jgi:hypothetical protein
MNRRESAALDRYITGNWGEDQFREEYDWPQIEPGDDPGPADEEVE